MWPLTAGLELFRVQVECRCTCIYIVICFCCGCGVYRYYTLYQGPLGEFQLQGAFYPLKGQLLSKQLCFLSFLVVSSFGGSAAPFPVCVAAGLAVGTCIYTIHVHVHVYTGMLVCSMQVWLHVYTCTKPGCWLLVGVCLITNCFSVVLTSELLLQRRTLLLVPYIQYSTVQYCSHSQYSLGMLFMSRDTVQVKKT